MKYNARQYALSLAQACDGQDKKTCESIMARWFDLLSERQQLSLLPNILTELEGYFNQGRLEALIESARPLDSQVQLWINDYLARRTGATEIKLTTKTDQALLAGLVLRYHDKELDLSLQGILKQFRAKIVE